MNRLNYGQENHELIEDYEQDDHELIDDVGDAVTLCEYYMSFLWNAIIEPNEDYICDEDRVTLTMVAKGLKLQAKKAKAYEDMYEKGENNENYLN
jgi:hypothetical protein